VGLAAFELGQLDGGAQFDIVDDGAQLRVYNLLFLQIKLRQALALCGRHGAGQVLHPQFFQWNPACFSLLGELFTFTSFPRFPAAPSRLLRDEVAATSLLEEAGALFSASVRPHVGKLLEGQRPLRFVGGGGANSAGSRLSS